jgi:ankyrin repeat protein
MEAADAGHDTIVVTLLAQGAETNARTQSGRTALMEAADSGRDTIVETLLAQGAEVNLQDQSGRTALMEAADFYSTNQSRASKRDRIVQLLLGRGANPNTVDNRGHTALKLAAKQQHFQVIPILAKGEEKTQYLLYAAAQGQEAFIKLLLAHGANVNAS